MFIQIEQSQLVTDPLINQLLPVLEQASDLLNVEYENYVSGNHLDIQKKLDESPVTQADLKINQFLVDRLAEITPDYPVLSEEGDYAQRCLWNICWMLDPLDGTKEFIQQRNEFTINLSLIEDSNTLFSVIVVPREQQVYLGYTNHLPYKYQFNSKQWWQYCQSVETFNNTIQIGLSHRSKSDKYQKFIKYLENDYTVVCREAGSAYKFCMMLEGKIDFYPRFHPTSEWDTSAGQGLLESIGGGLVSLKGIPFTYNVRNTVLNKGFIAYSNAEYKHLVLELLQQIDFSN